jgi:hypothetical protein
MHIRLNHSWHTWALFSNARKEGISQYRVPPAIKMYMSSNVLYSGHAGRRQNGRTTISRWPACMWSLLCYSQLSRIFTGPCRHSFSFWACSSTNQEQQHSIQYSSPLSSFHFALNASRGGCRPATLFVPSDMQHVYICVIARPSLHQTKDAHACQRWHARTWDSKDLDWYASTYMYNTYRCFNKDFYYSYTRKIHLKMIHSTARRLKYKFIHFRFFFPSAWNNVKNDSMISEACPPPLQESFQ